VLSRTDFIYTLCCESLIWTTLAVQLPSKTVSIACFRVTKESSEVYFVQGSKLYKLDQQAQITAVRTLSADIMSFCGPSYYSRGSIFSTNYDGQPFRVEIGSL
jgi:hypothetical protein